jgi:hypothetical protein
MLMISYFLRRLCVDIFGDERGRKKSEEGKKGDGHISSFSHFPHLSHLRHPGYIFLISVLVIGSIATTTAVSLILLGLATQQTGLAVVQSAQALELAQTCAERGLRSLHADLTYAGGDTFSFTSGTCVIHHVGGAGNANRTLCVEGDSGNTVRRLEILIRKLYPQTTVASWKEVSAYSLCS